MIAFDATGGAFAASITVSTEVIFSGGFAGNTSISGNDNRIFLDSAYTDIATIQGGDRNYLNLSDAGHDVIISDGGGGSEDNIIVGGYGDDHILIRDVPNKIYGMDGDDVFTFKLSDTAMIADLISSGANGFELSGGHDFFDGTSSYGDVLRLEDAGSLDFTQVDDDYIFDIETIDSENGLANVVKLNYTDVINMTDHNETLVLKMDGSDTLDFVNEGNVFQKQAGTKTINSQTYDVYSDGDVTLLVDADVAAANIFGLPA